MYRSLIALLTAAALFSACRKDEALAVQGEPKLDSGPAVVGLGVSRYPSIGPADAPVVLALFSGPARNLRQVYAKTVQKRFPKDVRVIWLYNVWPDQLADAKAALAAHRQGLFWLAQKTIAQKRRRARVPSCDQPAGRRFSAKASIDPLTSLYDRGLKLHQFSADLVDPELEATIIDQWRIGRALDLGRPARWQGADFLLVNGVRLLSPKPGFTPATEAIAELTRRVKAQLALAKKLSAEGTPRGRLARSLALKNGARRYVELVIDMQRPPRMAAIVLDPRLGEKRRREIRAVAKRARRILDRSVALLLVGAEGEQKTSISSLGPVTAPPRGFRWRGVDTLPTVKDPLGAALQALLRAKRLDHGFDGWRRVLVVSAAPNLAISRLERSLNNARLNNFALQLISMRALSVKQRERWTELTGAPPLFAKSDEALADLVLNELARAKTRRPGSLSGR